MSRRPLALVLLLIAIWVLLNGELSFAQFAFGALLATMFVLVISELRPVRPRLRRLHLIVPLVATVLFDAARSNAAVAQIALGLVRDRKVRSGFLDIPLELTDPHGLAALAIIVTSTPGTSWAGVSADGRTLTLHVLDLKDEGEWIQLIKQRYERPLMRIFE
jgi:multicomponent K+:H+ antiporter subunit E